MGENRLVLILFLDTIFSLFFRCRVFTVNPFRARAHTRLARRTGHQWARGIVHILRQQPESLLDIWDCYGEVPSLFLIMSFWNPRFLSCMCVCRLISFSVENSLTWVLKLLLSTEPQ